MNSLQYLSTQVDKVIGQDYTRPTKSRFSSLQHKPAIVPEEDEYDHDHDHGHESSQNSQISASSAAAVSGASDTREKSNNFLVRYITFMLNSILFFLFNYTPLTFWRNSSRDPKESTLLVDAPPELSLSLKSPTSPTATFGSSSSRHSHHRHGPSSASTPYLRLAPPPRPLLKLGKARSDRRHMKTLVLDLDETLIHTLSRGAKFSQGQMVEVRLQNNFATLYLVNKRPYCDEFLKCVSQWYRLVIFTASVPAYADPMIDWLEKECKYFDARFYRQHCTQSSEGFMKDLTKIEPDLSQVLIIDNSPVSYSLHQENAIGIEGWISDPSDHSLLNLLPFLEALRYTTDVRSLLALRLGSSAVVQ